MCHPAPSRALHTKNNKFSGTYDVPDTPRREVREAISRFAGDLRATHPDFVYSPRGEPQVLQNAGRIAWGSGRAGEEAAYAGWDVVIVRDGKIAALYVFLDETSEEFRRSSVPGEAPGEE